MTEGEAIVATAKAVSEFFKGDPKKTSAWFETPNFLFGDISPNDYAALRGWPKLLDVVLLVLGQNALTEIEL